MLSVFTSNDTLHLNDDRLGDAVLEGNATYPLPALIGNINHVGVCGSFAWATQTSYPWVLLPYGRINANWLTVRQTIGTPGSRTKLIVCDRSAF